MVTKRAQILDAIEERLKSITRANGYSSDIGMDCEYWRDFPLEYNGDTACGFFDEDEDAEQVNVMTSHRLIVEIHAIAFIRENAKHESSELIGDIIRAVGVDTTWDGLAVSTKLGGGDRGSNEKEIETIGRRACRVTQIIEIHYRTTGFAY